MYVILLHRYINQYNYATINNVKQKKKSQIEKFFTHIKLAKLIERSMFPLTF